MCVIEFVVLLAVYPTPGSRIFSKLIYTRCMRRREQRERERKRAATSCKSMDTALKVSPYKRSVAIPFLDHNSICNVLQAFKAE